MPAPVVAAAATKMAKRYLPKLLAILVPIALVLGGLTGMTMVMVLTSANTSSTTNTQQLGTGCVAGAAGTVPNPREGGGWPSDAQVGTPAAEQLANIAQVVEAGQDLKVSEYALVVGLAVTAQETGWRNLNHGDTAGPDSTGMFQQRDPWGPRADREDPYKAGVLFFQALMKVDGWDQMTIGRAGQAVQRSAQASGQWYQQHEPIARAGLAYVTGNSGVGQCASNGAAMECPATSWPGVEQGLTPDGLRVLRCGAQQQSAITSVGGVGDRPANVDDDHQAGRAVDFMIPDYASSAGVAMGDQLAEWLKANAAALGVKYLIWNAEIWSVERDKEGWRPYTSPSGGGPTLEHRDHVHVSVYGNAAGGSDAAAGEAVLPVKDYVLTARFGQAGSSWSSGYHTGLDFAAPIGTPILAPAAGTVVTAGWGGAYGNWTCVDVGNSTQTCFAHQIGLDVEVGDRVLAGQQIGKIGMTGNTGGPHVHVEVRDRGKTIDPATWLSDRGARP